MTQLSVAAPRRAVETHPSRLRWIMIGLGLLFLATGIVDFGGSGRADVAGQNWPLDFDINWVAAQRLVDHQPIYDRDASRAEGIALIGPKMARTSHGPYSSYIGSPPVALAHVPFLAFEHDTAARLFRLFGLLEMVAALVLTAWSLAPPARLPAALIGLGALFWGFPMVKSLALGQGNGLVMLGLGLGIWAASRERWGLAGASFGVATVLKISPVLLLVYLLLRGKRRAIWSAALTAGACFGAAALLGRAGDLVVWIRDVAPQVSRGTMLPYNQSIVGAVERLTDSVGAWHLLAYALWAVALFGLWRWRRGRPLDVLELGILVLVGLLAGPLTWDHYLVYALIPLVLMVDFTRWSQLRMSETVGLVVGTSAAVVLFHRGVQVPDSAAIAAHWSLRLLTERDVIVVVLLLFVAVWLLVRSPEVHRSGTEWPDDGATPVGGARTMVAAGVHERG
jgi:hypothetical protein